MKIHGFGVGEWTVAFMYGPEPDNSAPPLLMVVPGSSLNLPGAVSEKLWLICGTAVPAVMVNSVGTTELRSKHERTIPSTALVASTRQFLHFLQRRNALHGLHLGIVYQSSHAKQSGLTADIL